MKYLCLSLSSVLYLTFCAASAMAAESPVETSIVKIRGVKKNVHATITEINNGVHRPLKRCLTPCTEAISTAHPFYVTLSPPNRRYGAIYRDMKDAVREENTYTFRINLASREDEERRYVRNQLSRYVDTEKQEACKKFTKQDLTEKIKVCYKATPTMPPRSVRSGWCKMTYIVMEDGSVSGVEARECSEEIFRINSVETAKLFRYFPRLKDNEITKIRVNTTIRYLLDRGNGKPISPKNPL